MAGIESFFAILPHSIIKKNPQFYGVNNDYLDLILNFDTLLQNIFGEEPEFAWKVSFDPNARYSLTPEGIRQKYEANRRKYPYGWNRLYVLHNDSALFRHRVHVKVSMRQTDPKRLEIWFGHTDLLRLFPIQFPQAINAAENVRYWPASGVCYEDNLWFCIQIKPIKKLGIENDFCPSYMLSMPDGEEPESEPHNEPLKSMAIHGMFDAQWYELYGRLVCADGKPVTNTSKDIQIDIVKDSSKLIPPLPWFIYDRPTHALIEDKFADLLTHKIDQRAWFHFLGGLCSSAKARAAGRATNSAQPALAVSAAKRWEAKAVQRELSPRPPGWSEFQRWISELNCELCGTVFSKTSEFVEHLVGNTHKTNKEKLGNDKAYYQIMCDGPGERGFYTVCYANDERDLRQIDSVPPEKLCRAMQIVCRGGSPQHWPESTRVMSIFDRDEWNRCVRPWELASRPGACPRLSGTIGTGASGIRRVQGS